MVPKINERKSSRVKIKAKSTVWYAAENGASKTIEERLPKVFGDASAGLRKKPTTRTILVWICRIELK